MSVPAFEQSVHLPRFPVLQDLRCGPADVCVPIAAPDASIDTRCHSPFSPRYFRIPPIYYPFRCHTYSGSEFQEVMPADKTAANNTTTQSSVLSFIISIINMDCPHLKTDIHRRERHYPENRLHKIRYRYGSTKGNYTSRVRLIHLRIESKTIAFGMLELQLHVRNTIRIHSQ
jgi:hypothetical protein